MYYAVHKIIVVFILAAIFSRIIPRSMRAAMFPYVTGALILSYSLNLFPLNTRLTYILQGMLPPVCSSFLIYFAPHEPVSLRKHEWLLLIFYLYFIAISLFGEFPIIVVMSKSLTLVNYLLVGWSVGRYAAQNKQVGRLMIVLTWYAIPYFAALYFTAYDYQRFAEGERMGDVETLNPNLIGLICVSLLVAPILTLYAFKVKIKHQIVAIVAIMIGVYVLIGSGSRNAAVAFLAGITVMICFCKGSPRGKLLASALGIAVFIYVFTGGSSGFRVFEISRDAFEGARGTMFRKMFESTNNMQWVFGGRSWIDIEMENGFHVLWGNAHSMYMQILFEAGWIGICLFTVTIVSHCCKAYSHKEYGRYSLVFLITVLALGGAESYPIRNSSFASLLWGISLGIISVIPKPELSRRKHLAMYDLHN